MVSVTIPDSTVKIDSNAFKDCVKLEMITIGSGLKEISVINAIPRGVSIYYMGTVEQWHDIEVNSGHSFSQDSYPVQCSDGELLPSGNFSENLTWQFGVNGTLTISGEGEIPAYDGNTRPWKDFIDKTKKVVIENGVKAIGEQSFYNCNNLSNIIISNSVEIIGKGFVPYSVDINYDGTSTEWFELLEANSDSELNTYVVNCQDKTLYRTGFCGENVIWEMNPITNCMTISGYGETKDYYAPFGFEGVWTGFIDDIHTVVIEDGVESIGDYMFAYCTNLKSISIPNSVTKIGDCAFYNCSSLANFTIPEGVTEIGNSAFRGCAYFTNISFPESVTEIGEGAFAECNLLSVTIPASVTKIGSGSFQGVEGIFVDAGNPNYSSDENGVLFNKDKTTLIQYPSKAEKEHYTIPDCVTSIYGGAFLSSKNLKSILLHDNITSIGESAFNSCSMLESISIPYGIKSIPARAFMYCTGLESVVIPGNINEIGRFAFGYCSSLENVIISEGVKIIGDLAFEYCENLKNVNIPNSVTTIGGYAFAHCTRMKKIIIPDSVSKIGSDAFRYSGLEDVVLGKGVTTIWGGTFGDCKNLREIVIPENMVEIVGNAFDWSSLEKIWIPTSVTEIGFGALGDDIKEVYYMGTKSQWQKVKKYYRDFEDVEIHYSCRKEEAPSTCTEQGSITYFCDCCGAEKLYRYIDRTEHNYVSTETPATCTKHGITDYTCQDCGASYFDNTANPTGHNINADGVCESCGKTEVVNTTASNNQLLSFDSVLQLIMNLISKMFDAILVV